MMLSFRYVALPSVAVVPELRQLQRRRHRERRRRGGESLWEKASAWGTLITAPEPKPNFHLQP